MNWKYFIGACFLVFMALLKYGIPIPALIAGIGLAVLVNWMKYRKSAPERVTYSKGRKR